MKRDPAIDIAKAIGILLMILGHCPGVHPMFRNLIFSFHMPLFFIFSGYFYRQRSARELFRTGIGQLVRPYLITSITYISLCLLFANYTLAYKKVIGTIMSNGGWSSEAFGSTLPYIGPIWFLLALFWCKGIYSYLRNFTRHYLISTFVLSTAALLVGKYIINLPFGILTGFCGLVFYAMGDVWHQYEDRKIPFWAQCLALIVWGFCILRSHLELASFDCRHYPISMLGAFVGTYVTWVVAKHVPTRISPPLVWLGRNTLLILCYHTLAWPFYDCFANVVDLPRTTFCLSCFVCCFSIIAPILHEVVRKRLMAIMPNRLGVQCDVV